MIQFTQGDTAILNLTATDGDGNPINIAGASFVSYIKGTNGVVVSFPNSQHSIVSSASGQYDLALASGDTASCGLGNNKDVLTVITIGSSIVCYRGQGILKVNPLEPLQ